MVKAFTPYFLLLTFHDLYSGGGKRIRTADHLVANQALSQLSYTPNKKTILKSETLNPKLFCFEIQYSNFEFFFLGGPR